MKLLYLTPLLLLVFAPQAFADYSEVTIVPAAGSGAPECEETADGCYIPSTVTVDVGGVVIMSNTDTAAHTFTSGTAADGPSGKFDTGLVMAGNSFEWSPDTVGEYPYFCMVHPWMEGLIVVKGESNGGDQPDEQDYPTDDNTNNDNSEIEKLRNEISQLKSENTNLKADNRKLSNQNNQFQNTIQDLQQQVTDLNAILMEQVKVIYEWITSR
ncbi:MAG: hypothetical protein OEM28_02510 [Nitrosopumilus sp.]|nr:hypothetical protein [Nitrosopumilus sp.]MDH3486981.1 hypothetical protein [Nitrosopumilus sp.]